MNSGNIKLRTGRICRLDLKRSAIVSNIDREELIKNIEEGVKKAAVKFIDEGYDLMSSCQGHPPEEAGGQAQRNIKICVERKDHFKITNNVTDINRKHGTSIKFTKLNEEIIKTEINLIKDICAKDYVDPAPVYITFGRYDNCEENYAIFIEHFNEYTW